jgi:hypothetical protein
MDTFLIWLEATSLSVWVREYDSVFAFPAILSLHTLGMGFVAGLSAAIDLRILGFAPSVPLMEMRRFFPVIWAAFWLNAVSGVILLIGYPTKAVTNPVFYGKLAFIALAVVAFRSLRDTVFVDASLDLKSVPRKGKAVACASLVCWAGAITAGRLLAYTYHKLMAI